MYRITVIGLGVDVNDYPKVLESYIKSSEKVVVRTALAESYKNLNAFGKEITALDFVYEKSRNFDTLNKNLANEVIKMAKISPVCYLVDGSAIEDNSVKYILDKVKDVEVISGVSATSKCLERLKISLSKYTAVSAYEVEDNYSLTAPLVVNAIDSAIIASKVKLFLSKIFGEELDVFVSSNDFTKKIKLYELDRLKIYNYSLSLYIPEVELKYKEKFDFNDLIRILEILRSPNGCPWDREQTEKSILKNVVEEAYELVDAVNLEDDFMIVEETGDLILQSAFYIAFGEEGARYTRCDVLSDLCKKLITRHTHVFGDDVANKSSEALSVWNNNKIIEKGYGTATEYLNAVPKSMPSLMRAEKVGKRANKYGFDFDGFKSALESLLLEVEELKKAVLEKNAEEVEKECGDLIFSAVNVSRHLGVSAELSLKNTIEKFIKRFSLVEEELKNQNKDFNGVSQSELDDIYNLVKAERENGN